MGVAGPLGSGPALAPLGFDMRRAEFPGLRRTAGHPPWGVRGRLG